MKQIASIMVLFVAACSAEPAEPRLQIDNARARATVPGQTSTAAYLTIANDGGEDRLVGVSSTAGEASLHSTDMADGVMRMRPLDSLAIPAGQSVELSPGGRHVMVTGLSRPLAEGDRLPLTLRFERSGTRQVEATAVADPAAQ